MLSNKCRMFQLKIFQVSKQDLSTSEDHSEVHLKILSFLLSGTYDCKAIAIYHKCIVSSANKIYCQKNTYPMYTK